MKYLLTFVIPERSREAASPEEMQAGMEAWSAFDREATEAGALIACEPVEDPEAKIAVGEGGDRTVTDGPFAESKELISYAVYDVRSREEAIEWATRFVRLHQEHWAGWEGEADVQQVFEAPPSP
jgi:hypothetical protein